MVMSVYCAKKMQSPYSVSLLLYSEDDSSAVGGIQDSTFGDWGIREEYVVELITVHLQVNQQLPGATSTHKHMYCGRVTVYNLPWTRTALC